MPRDGSGGCTGCCREGFPKRQRFLSSATKEHKNAKRKGGWGRRRHAGSLWVKTWVSGRDGSPGQGWGDEGPSHMEKQGALAPTPSSKNENALLHCLSARR